MAIALIEQEACGLAFEFSGKGTTLFGHQIPLSGEHPRLNGCPVSLDHYIVIQRKKLTFPLPSYRLNGRSIACCLPDLGNTCRSSPLHTEAATPARLRLCRPLQVRFPKQPYWLLQIGDEADLNSISPSFRQTIKGQLNKKLWASPSWQLPTGSSWTIVIFKGHTHQAQSSEYRIAKVNYDRKVTGTNLNVTKYMFSEYMSDFMC